MQNYKVIEQKSERALYDTLASELACGKNRIRTCETLLGFTRFPGVPLQPLEHLSNKNICTSFCKIECKCSDK